MWEVRLEECLQNHYLELLQALKSLYNFKKIFQLNFIYIPLTAKLDFILTRYIKLAEFCDMLYNIESLRWGIIKSDIKHVVRTRIIKK